MALDQSDQEHETIDLLIFKHRTFFVNYESLERIELVVGEGLHECSTVGCRGHGGLDLQGVQTSAVGGCHADEVHNQFLILLCSDSKILDLDYLQVWAPDQKLAKGPLLQLIAIVKVLNSEFFEALFLVDATPKVIEELVEHVRRRTLDVL